jgi:hypothetical protein
MTRSISLARTAQGSSEIDGNPYSPPNAESEAVGPSFRWRLIPAGVIGLLGVLSFGIGIYFAALVIHEIFTEGFTSFVLESPIAIGFYMVPGVSWIASGLLLWKGKYYYAILLALVGIAIPVTLSSLFAS